MPKRVLVTAGLPYANGSLHLGHLVEYCQADMYVRALRRMGEDARYVCASDAHGTPIEINAARLGLRPEELVERFRVEQRRDFERFDVAFDHFSWTHSATARAVVERAYHQLRAKGMLEDREVDGNWCDHDQRFLPDRFIKGTCPRCAAGDQYGDVCEACGSTYTPDELKEPHCVLCGAPPVTKKSQHVFFRLGHPSIVNFLREFIDAGALQADVANYVRSWLDAGLRDWCISRDGPYFGFEIPDRPGKYFYVWLDAPLGYIASSVEWGEMHGLGFADLWQSPDTRIEHFIGKDIVYFHTLFWPAMLHVAGYSQPSKVHVHGMLTVNGEKMSKTRGTFIKASTLAEHIEPQALRYYYACKYGADSSDLDLSFDDFVLRVNGELVNKHANLFSRASQFIAQKLDGRLGELPFAASHAQQAPTGDGSMLDLARRVVASAKECERAFRAREISHAMRELSSMADIGNEFMQRAKPWEQLKSDPEAARTTCTFAVNVCHALAMYLWPIVPRFAEAGARVLGSTIDRIDARTLFAERSRPMGTFERLFERIDAKQVAAVVDASKATFAQAASGSPAVKGAAAGGAACVAASAAAPAPASAPAVPSAAASAASLEAARPAVAPLKPLIAYDTFSQLDLRVGCVLSAQAVPKSKKLVVLQVDLGEPVPRQVVAGIGTSYAPEALVGKRVVMVANLQPTKLMGVESQGMVLAAGEAPELGLLTVDRPASAGTGVK